jgi:hypothetical protein
MKKIMIVGSAMLLLSSTAFASKARLQSLGEDKDGSYYISDYRNVYINPSELNSLGNMVVAEWGTAGYELQRASIDPDYKPKAQGGVFYGLSNGLKVGAILGDETDVASLTRMLASNVYGQQPASAQFMQTADNVVDVFVAGKGSINWGANLLYSASKNEVVGTTGTTNRHDQNAYAVRLGASQNAWNAHALIALGAKSNAPDGQYTPSYKGKLGIRVGGGYDLTAENKMFGMYETYKWTQDNSQDPERDGSFWKGQFGLGHIKKITDSSSLFAKLYAEVLQVKLAAAGSMVEAKIDRMALPVTVGFEHKALDWLTVRGSVVQNLFGTVKDSGLQQNFGDWTAATTNTGKVIRSLAAARYGSSLSGTGGKKTIANSTIVNAGAGLTFGSVVIDGLVSTTSTAGTEDTKKGVLSLDNLETRVGITYNF